MGMKGWGIRGDGGWVLMKMKRGESEETGERDERAERECEG